MKPNIQLPKSKKRRLACTGKDGRQLVGGWRGQGREGGTWDENKSLKALYGILPMNGNETYMTALHYATHVNKKGKKKKSLFLISKSTS